MSVDFYEEEDVAYRKRAMQTSTQRVRGLAGLLLRFGLAKNKRGAQFILISFAIIVFITSIIIFYRGSSYTAKVNPEIAKIQAELELEGYSGPELLVKITERI